MKQYMDNWVSRLHQRTKNSANLEGVTLQEVLIGIAVAAVIAAGSIFLGARFIGQGQFASSRQTLQTAALATEQVYASIIEGGGRNFAGTKVSGVTYTSAQLSAIGASKLNALGEDIKFVPVIAGTAATCTAIPAAAPIPAVAAAAAVCVGTTAPAVPVNFTGLEEKDVWVEVLALGTGMPQHAQAIRLGVRSSNGATLCIVVVKQASTPGDLGRYYQSENAEDSKATPAICDMSEAAVPGSGLSAATTYTDSLVDPG